MSGSGRFRMSQTCPNCKERVIHECGPSDGPVEPESALASALLTYFARVDGGAHVPFIRQHLLAIEAEAAHPATEGLDVERLATAIYNCDLADPITFHIQTVDKEAARIAVEYARLAHPATEGLDVEFLNFFGSVAKRLNGVPCDGHLVERGILFHRERECRLSSPEGQGEEQEHNFYSDPVAMDND